MRRERRWVMAAIVVSLAVFTAVWAADRPGVRRWKAVEIAVPANDSDEACLGRPIALALDADHLYIVDAQDGAVKVFSKDGEFLRAVGRKGRGPGELTFPSGVSVIGGRLYVADKSNFRVQAFDRAGKPCGGFSVPFAPDKVWALTGETLLVTSNPTGRAAAEKMLHISDVGGRRLWEGLEARASSDPVFDAFRNMILVCPGAGGEFFVIFRSGERSILHFAGSGALVGKIPVDERHAFQPMDLPFQGPKKRLLGFCWAAAWDRGFFYISAPAPVEGKDLGPGRLLSVIDREGRLTASIELPCPVHRFVVEGERIFAVDDDGGLRIFEVVR
jgi:hypothetical protein